MNCNVYVWSSHIARVRINRVRLPILLVVSCKGKNNISLSPFAATDNLVSRDGLGSPVSRQPAYGVPPDFRDGVHLLERYTLLYVKFPVAAFFSSSDYPQEFVQLKDIPHDTLMSKLLLIEDYGEIKSQLELIRCQFQLG